MREASEEIPEVRVAVVGPVELHRAPHEEACLGEHGCILVPCEQHVQGGAVAGELERRLHQRALHRRGRSQQARPADRRKRHRADELRVVVDAVALMGVRPGPVEDVFAVGVVLGEDRHGADQAARAVQEHDLRQPAGLCAGAAGVDQRREKLVTQERLLAGKRVPFGGIDAGERIGDADAFQVATIQWPSLVGDRR